MGFTENQLKAINSDIGNILVSAAAGSGKTTVLVERIIGRILDENDPVDIDRMLVLTFTKAAAGQMKDKILEEIEKRAAKNPQNTHLAKQAMLIQNAQISTFHGFCQEIIKNHFYEIDADPQLRVADAGEIKLMQQDALKKVLEDAYEEASDDFLAVVEAYASGKNDKGLEDIILRIYNLSQAQPDPEKWLLLCEQSYDAESVEELKKKPWFDDYLASMKAEAREAVKIGQEIVKIADMDGGPAKYRPMFEDDLNYALGIAEAGSYEDIGLLCKVHEKLDLARISAKDGVDEELKAQSKKLREVLYKITDDIKKSAIKKLDLEINIMQEVAPLARVIISLTKAFSKAFSDAKIDNGVIDFNDMEHLAIKILRGGDGVSAAAYRDRFVEIYVDEYQDSNLTQEEIISLISRDNTFMVGDVKQSIYRFRMARPDLFLGKYKSFGHEMGEGEGLRIDLSDNFRSRYQVLDSANEIFSQIMNESIGGIEYDDAASLHYGHTYDGKEVANHTQTVGEAEYDQKASPDGAKDPYRAELILAQKPEEMSDAETEATAIGTRINQLVGVMDVTDKNGGLRKIRYSDIVILLRSMTGRDAIYRDVLTSMNIPSYVTTGVGYFSAKEIDTLISFLAVIDNPLQDIHLASALRSELFGYTDEELALIRLSDKEAVYLYEALKSASAECENDALKGKINRTLDVITHYRDESEYMSVYEILKEIIDGDYGDLVRSGSNGNQAEANLNMLLKKAEDFGRLSYKGLFHFLRYLDQIRKYEVDYGEAGITDEADDNVRIMTIHKSKGLEFPVVFVSALTKKRNTQDEKAEIITDPDLGLGLNYVDASMRLKKTTLLREYLVSRLKKENLAEEIRVLYVALTRAKEKLIMVASGNDFNKEFFEKSKPLSMCESYFDMIGFAYHEKNGLNNTSVIEMGVDDYIYGEIEEKTGREETIEYLESLVKSGVHNDIYDNDDDDNNGVNDGKNSRDSITREIKKRLSYEYSHSDEAARYVKVSVSELKKASMEEMESTEDANPTHDMSGEYEADRESEMTSESRSGSGHAVFGTDEAYVPDFAREGKDAPEAGTFYGTAFHRMAELWDYDISFGRENEVSEAEVSAFLDEMSQKGRIDKLQLGAVRAAELLTFIRSSAAMRMGRAYKGNNLFREQPFTFGVEPGPMLVQGIIDAYWIEDGEIVILDYKTDRVSDASELIKRYHVQLEYYSMALSRLLQLPVKETLIYSTRLKEVINL